MCGVDKLCEAEINKYLERKIPLVILGQTGSTNDVAKKLARDRRIETDVYKRQTYWCRILNGLPLPNLLVI